MKRHGLGKRAITDEIGSLRRSLRSFDRSLRRLVPLLTAVLQNGAQPEKRRPRVRLSAKARASLVLQGRYMGFMRQLKPRQKSQVRRVKEAKGVRAAIVMAKIIARRPQGSERV